MGDEETAEITETTEEQPLEEAAPEFLAPEERRVEALTLRRRGGTYRQIAATLRKKGVVSEKYSQVHAYNDVRRELRYIIERLPEIAQEVVALDIQRLDRLLMAVMPAAESGDLESVSAVLSIMGRRAALLGLDKQPPPAQANATIRVAVNVTNQNIVVRATGLQPGSDPTSGSPVALLMDRGRDQDGQDGGLRAMADRGDREGP